MVFAVSLCQITHSEGSDNMSHRVLVPPDLSSSGRQFLLDRYYELIIHKEWERPEDAVQNCDAALLHDRLWPKATLERAGDRLKVISTPGAGQNLVDLPCASMLGIWVVDVDTASRISQAEYEIALLLSCCKQIARMDFLAHAQNEMDFHPNNSTELHGKRIGFVGWDEVAFLVARKCRLAFGMTSCCFMAESGKLIPSEVQRCSTLQELFVISDFICIHANEAAVLDLGLFQRMKPTAYLICMSGLPELQCQDLCDALHMGMLAGAAINACFRMKPGGTQLLQHPRVTPILRLAYCTYEAISRMDLFAAQALDRILSGRSVPELCTHPANPRIYLQA